MSQISDVLKAALEKAKGIQVKRVWYEPLHGPCMEMQGYAGGWMYETTDGREFTIGGFTAVEAIEAIMVTASLRAYSEYDAAHRRAAKNSPRRSSPPTSKP